MQGTDQIFEVFLQGIASKNVFMDIVYGIFPRQIITIVDDQSFPRATETPKRMTTEPALETLASVLAQTLNPGTRQQAEAHLTHLEGTPAFAVHLLQLLKTDLSPALQAQGSAIHFAAVLYFKNFIKKYWDMTDEESAQKLSPQDRALIKSSIVDLMISSPAALQVQLTEALTLIASSDFPEKWDSLVQELVSKFNATDYTINLGVLRTAHSIFKRYRHEFRTDALYNEINFVLGVFAAPFLAIYQQTDALIDANAKNGPALKTLFETVFLLNKVFFSLNAQDLPAFFEDHQDEFMVIFHKYLEYKNPLVESDDDEQAGVLEKVKASICEIIGLYAQKYEDDFTKLPVFVQCTWNLLTTVGPQQKNDYLVSKAISFLTSVVKPSRHRQLFADPNTLQSICSMIILPNMTLRESDIELFEDDPMEYTRRNLEYTDTESRRRATADLVRGLLEQFAKEVTEIFTQNVGQYLAEYEKDPVRNWRSKDTALFLITSLSARTFTAQLGATQTNELIPTLPVFVSHIVPDLQKPVDGSVHPIIKVDAIKYLEIFRGQLTKEQLLEIIPSLSSHLASKNCAVQTYAAYCLERVFAMKTGPQFIFQSSDILPMASSIVGRLFDLIEADPRPAKLAENDYLMKAIMRIVIVLNKDAGPLVESTLSRLTNVIKVISKTPTNPKFNHYAFETLASLVRFSCSSNVAFVTNFETFLFPPFQEILQQDNGDFNPYVFQILSQLLAFHAEPSLPDQYAQMLPFFLSPAFWEAQGNVPALVKLLQTYFVKGSKEIVAKDQLRPVLGVAHKLISSRMNDQFGFELLTSLFECVSTQDLMIYIKNIFVLLLTRLMQNNTTKFTGGMIRFLCFIFTINKPGFGTDEAIGVFDSIQATPLFLSVLQGVLIPELKSGNISPEDWKLVCVGFTKLLTQSRIILSDAYFSTWPALFEAIVQLLQKPLKPSAALTEEDELQAIDNQDEFGYQSNYSRLATVGAKKKDYAAEVVDPNVFLKQSLVALRQSQPRKIEAVASQLVPEAVAFLG